MDRHAQARSWCISLPAALVLYSGFAAAAVGTTNSRVECDGTGKNLHSFDIPISELTVEVVDHMPAASDAAPGDGLALEAPIWNTAAPVLVLTPRVAGILQDVFDSDAAASDDESDDYVPDAALPAESTDKMAPVTLIDEKAGESRFQRQMYRKDI